MRKQYLYSHAALYLEGRVQDRILRPSCTRVGGKTSLFVRQRHAKNRVDEPLPSTNFLSSLNTRVYLMNNRCVLWSLCEHMHIGYKYMYIRMDYHIKQLPLHCRVCGHRVIKRKSKKEIYECKAFAADLQLAFSINTLTDNPQVHPEHFCKSCHLSMTRGISARAEGVHHRCALTRFVWEVHANEGCKVHVYAFMQHNQYTESYHRCVSISKSVQEVISGSIQLAEVVNQDSHLICSLHIF